MAKKSGNRSGSVQSPLAGLASRATTESATAPKHVAPPKAITGQYLLNSFVLEKENQTKLQIVKVAVENVDTASMKSSLTDMVELARKMDIANGIPEKTVTKDGPLYRNAANARSVIQKVFGALKFAPDSLAALGFTDKLGYHAASVLAKKALENKALKWDGSKGLTDEERSRAAYRRMEDKAVKEVQKENIRQEGESYQDYMIRCSEMVDDKMAEMERQQEEAIILDDANKILAKGADHAKMVADVIHHLIAKAETEAAANAAESKKAGKKDKALI